METSHQICRTKRFIQDLLKETDMPRNIKFDFKKRDGVLVVKLKNSNKYGENIQNPYGIYAD